MARQPSQCVSPLPRVTMARQPSQCLSHHSELLWHANHLSVSHTTQSYYGTPTISVWLTIIQSYYGTPTISVSLTSLRVTMARQPSQCLSHHSELLWHANHLSVSHITQSYYGTPTISVKDSGRLFKTVKPEVILEF